MNLHNKIVRSTEVISAPVQEELVMFDVEAGKYYGFNAIATTVWQHLEAPVTVETICRELSDEYDISLERCREEILAFLSKLEAKGLIRLAGQDE
jgi:Coenzyme PQQ synthesis protein D (PqqD)